jgi:ABC-type multidrug transport system permease subunit
VYVPIALLRGWIHDAARFNPVTYILEAGRGFISGSPANSALAFGVAIALALAFLTWSRLGLRRAERASA